MHSPAQWHGLFLPLPTPFREGMAVDTLALCRNLEAYAQSGIHGYLTLGNEGEFRQLGDDERKQVLKTVVRHKGEWQRVIAHGVYDCTALSIDWLKFAQDCGCDAATLCAPAAHWGPLSAEGLIDYFCDCAEAVEIPVFLQTTPKEEGAALSFEVIQFLSNHPHIVGLLDTTAKGIERDYPLCSESFAVLSASVQTLYPAMADGGLPGGVLRIAAALPAAGMSLFHLAQSGKTEQGMELHRLMQTLDTQIEPHGIAGLKAAMDLAGLAGGSPRKPFSPLGEAERDALKEFMKKEQLL